MFDGNDCPGKALTSRPCSHVLTNCQCKTLSFNCPIILHIGRMFPYCNVGSVGSTASKDKH
jgi:hypothetical protein